MMNTQKQAEYRRITPQEAKKMLDENKNIILLDVRTPSEFKESYIQNAVLIPEQEIEQRVKNDLPDKDSTILVYCHSGGRSQSAAKKLASMGYTNIHDFGGIMNYPYDIVLNKQ